MSDLTDLALPRAVLLADVSGCDVSAVAEAFAAALREAGRPVGVRSLADGDGPVARRALGALEETDDLLVLTAPGLLTRLDARGGTLADAGTALRYKGVSAGVALGTTSMSAALAHTLTLHSAVLRARDIPLIGALELPAGPQSLAWWPPARWETMTS